MSPVSCFLSTLSHLLAPVFYLLSPASCLLSSVSYLLSHVSYFLSPISCLLSPVSSLLYFPSCLLFPFFCLLSPLSCILGPTVNWLVSLVWFTFFSLARSSLITKQSCLMSRPTWSSTHAFIKFVIILQSIANNRVQYAFQAQSMKRLDSFPAELLLLLNSTTGRISCFLPSNMTRTQICRLWSAFPLTIKLQRWNLQKMQSQ